MPKFPLVMRLHGLSCCALLTVSIALPLMSAEIAGVDFLNDEQLKAISDKVTSITTAYTLEYSTAEQPGEVSRRTSIKEWMTKDNYRSEVVMETLTKGKPTVTKKEMQVCYEGKNYLFDALDKVMTISEGSSPEYVNFSNPLAFKNALVARLLFHKGVSSSLPEIGAKDYAERVGAMIHVSEDKPNEFALTEKGAPESGTKFIMRFSSPERVLPDSVDGWGELIQQAPDGTITKEVKRLGIFKIVAKGTARVGSAAFVYPKQIDWLDGAGTRVACVIRVSKLTLNDNLSEEIFSPDFSIADRIDDNSKKK